MLISKIILKLGKKCNMNCAYCIQGSLKHTEDLNPLPYDKLMKCFPEKGDYKVTFFGGEPMLYMDRIERLGHLIKEKNPDAKMDMVTNGTLFTKDNVKILNELGIVTYVSHDGYYYEQTRGRKDILLNPEHYLSLNQRGITSTNTLLSLDHYMVWEYFLDFQQKHGLKEKEIVCIGDYTTTYEQPDPSLFIYKNPEWEQMLDKTFFNLKKNILKGDFDCYEYRYVYPILQQVLTRLSGKAPIVSMCGAESCVVHMDIEGNFYHCHDSFKPYTNLEREGKAVVGAYNPYINTPTCQKCPAYVYCGGGCIMNPLETKKYECYVKQERYKRLLLLMEDLAKEGVLKLEPQLT